MKRFKQFREEMTPQMKKAVKTIAKPKYGVSNYDTASDKGGSLDSMGGTPRKDQSAAAKAVRKAKKVIKRDGGQSTVDRVKRNAEKGYARRNMS